MEDDKTKAQYLDKRLAESINKLFNPTRAARIRATGKVVYVYALLLGGWCDTADYQTTYLDSQLEIIN